MVSQATVTVGEEETAVTAIVRAISDIEDASPDELYPVGSVVNPTLLNSFVDEGQNTDIGGQIEFPYGDYTVIVRADGTILISVEESNYGNV